MSAMRLLLVAWIVCVASFCASAALPSYSFVNFEADSGWKAGPFPQDKPSMRLVQGAASIVAVSEPDSRQLLQLGPSKPFPALFIDSSAAAKGLVAYCELLAKPVAVDEQGGQEFFDFGGAVLGFFRAGNSGEIRALFAKSKDESVWISTGIRFALDNSGLPAQWMRICVKLNRKSGRWDLLINGAQALSGLQAIPGEPEGLPFWLYGDESAPSLFDDILLSTEDPDRLEKMILWQAERKKRLQSLAAGRKSAKTVVQSMENSQLRQQQPGINTATSQLTAPVLRGWHAVLENNGQTIEDKGGGQNVGGMNISVVPFAPAFDAHNNPLPMTLTLVADAELKPGADLSKIRWIVAEMKKWPDVLGETMATGNFSTGLVQSVPITGKWVQKATLTYVWTAGPSGEMPSYFKFDTNSAPSPSEKRK
jgi:hypothetical protein